MGLYGIKPLFVRRLRVIEDLLVARRVSPDAITAAAVAVSVLAGGAIAAGGIFEIYTLWLLVPPLVLARLALNALDGSVARRTGRARPFGAALNELGDRASDAVLLGSAAVVVDPVLAIGAVAASGAASLTGVTAQALTGRRDNAGPMGKADRAAVVAGAVVVGAFSRSATPLTVGLWIVVGGAVLTIAARMLRMRRALPRPRVAALLVQSEIEVPDEAELEEEMLHALGR